MILSIVRPQHATWSVSVLMGDVFFVSVQSKRGLHASGRSQAKTLQDKPTLKQIPHLYCCYAASFKSVVKKGQRS